MFKNNQSYSSINLAKSALSTMLSIGTNVKIGENELVKRFMKGIFRLRPSSAKYSTTWDADVVLKLLREWPENENLNLKQLSQKLAALLALTTGQRLQFLAAIEVSDININTTMSITTNKIMKTTSVRNKNPSITLPRNDSQNLCVVKCMEVYLNKTSVFRQGEKGLFLSIQKPHKAVKPQTIGNWLVSLLDRAGISNGFQAHSFRHASTSKVALKGVRVDSILSHVGWSKNSEVFAKFYNRPIEKHEFVNTILDVD